jgi:hypothetical protein
LLKCATLAQPGVSARSRARSSAVMGTSNPVGVDA